MTAIKYLASPALRDTIEGVERNKEIPLDYTLSIPDGSIHCYDIDRDRTIGILKFHRGLDESEYICEEAVKEFFKVFDRTLEMTFELTEASHHRKIYKEIK